VAGCCVHGNEPRGSMKGGEFVDLLNDCWLVLHNVGYDKTSL
jgi:hypothetical protein